MKLDNVSKEELIKYIDNGEYMKDIANKFDVSRDTVRRKFEQLNILDYYRETSKLAQKPIKFRIRNPELKKRLELFGPLHNVVD